MPRGPRKSVGGKVYHVINRANGRLMIFKKPLDFIAFENILAQGLERVPMRLCGYCIMGNHWHLLLWPRNDGDLSKFMQWITNTHSRRWHAAHGTTGIGHVYQGRFKSFPVQHDMHYLKVLQYIESNPLRAGLVNSSHDWQYSSLYQRNTETTDENINEDTGEIETQQTKLKLYNPVQIPADWNKYVNIVPSEEDQTKIENSIKRGTPFGGETWTKRTAVALGLESTIRPRGRPRKSRK